MKKMTFNEFCEHTCDGLYDPEVGDDYQCTGYIQLKKMMVEKTSPASKQEMKRWETNPTEEEMRSTPDIKYLRFLHPLLRKFVVENWLDIVTLKID